MISNKYNIIEKIGNGNFGNIFKGENIRTKEKVAIKVSPINSEYNLLKNETRVYQLLGNRNDFPKLKWFGADDKNNYLVIDLLGDSLSQLKQKNRVLSLPFVAKIGMQIIERLEIFHNLGLIHRDIKPDNFVFGINNNFHLLYLVDYGFSKGYKQKTNRENVPKNIIGTINYISLNVHKKYEPGKRDDLESVCYVLTYLLDLMTWERYNEPSLNNILNIITEKEKIAYSDNIPVFIRNILLYVQSLSLEDEPDYSLIKSYINTYINIVI